MIIECTNSFTSEAGDNFKRRYYYDAMSKDGIYRLRQKYNKKNTYLPVTVDEFHTNFRVFLSSKAEDEERYIM